VISGLKKGRVFRETAEDMKFAFAYPQIIILQVMKIGVTNNASTKRNEIKSFTAI
jgi:hypothetical protein